LGGRWSAVAAQYLGYQLGSLRGQVEVLLPPPTGVLEDKITDLKRTDVLVVYDFRRYQPETIAFAEASARRGVALVLFTDPELSPVSDVAEVILAVPVALASPLDTLVPALAATDLVLARVVDRLGPRAEERLRRLEAVRQETARPAPDRTARP
jgi:DNA-binding MurR/RpiR family transcriptional regulator